MLRRTLNASRLQEEVSRRINRLPEVIDDGVKIGVPRPEPQAPDKTGCNWTMRHFRNAAGFEAVIARVLAKVQAEYNLAASIDAGDEAGERDALKRGASPLGEAKPAPRTDPFGDARASKPVDPFADTAGPDPDSDSAETPPRRRTGDPFSDA